MEIGLCPMEPKQQNRLSCLDGIRGWASLMVVFSHLLQCFLLSSTPQYDKPYNRFISDGNLAVFVFFVLSGFALTIKFVKNEEDRSLVSAVVSRYFRLTLPIFFASSIVFLMMKAGLFYNSEAAPIANSKSWLGTFYQFEPSTWHLLDFSFYRSLFNFDGKTAYIEALWTMPIEFDGSMIVFMIVGMFVLGREKGRVSLIPLGLLGVYIYRGHATMACFIIGYYLAELYESRARAWKAVQWLATAAFFLPIYISTYHRPQENLKTMVLALLIVFGGVFSPPLNWLFSTGVSRFMGKISFPLYLIHVPVICSFSSLLYIKITPLNLGLVPRANIVLVSTVVVSLLAAAALLPMERFSVRCSNGTGRFIARHLRFTR
jgi:peptidoglycan/LPS O-acetylase OafA/YrhL